MEFACLQIYFYVCLSICLLSVSHNVYPVPHFQTYSYILCLSVSISFRLSVCLFVCPVLEESLIMSIAEHFWVDLWLPLYLWLHIDILRSEYGHYLAFRLANNCVWFVMFTKVTQERFHRSRWKLIRKFPVLWCASRLYCYIFCQENLCFCYKD